MKKIFSILAVIITISLIIYSCNRESVAGVNHEETKLNNKVGSSSNRQADNRQLITSTLFMYGVRGYNISSDGALIFDTYRDFNVNNEIGNLKNFSFRLDNEILSLDENYEIKMDNSKLIINTPQKKVVVDENLKFDELDIREKLLLSLYVDLNSNDNKDTFDNFSARMMGGTGGGCSWANTYYISGMGWTASGAWADYHDSVSTMNGLPGGTTCSPLGDPALETYDIPGTGLHYYTVNKAWCCK